MLTERGYPVHATTQPSRGELGEIARHHSDIYRGYTLACLVAADRYHHLRTDIRPRKAAGDVVVCDRYVAASLVLQRMDGVPLDFLETLNRAADIPDLAVILTADPAVSARRIETRGTRHRFETGIETSAQEAGLYRDAAQRLTTAGYPVSVIDTTHKQPSEVAGLIARRIATLYPRPTAG